MNEAAASLRLAGLLASRLCHDLAGAAGIVVAALELAAETPSFAAEAMPVACAAAQALTARLRLVRAGWGAAGAPLTLHEIAALSRGFGTPERPVTVDFAGLTATPPLGANAARLLVNLLMLGAESLPRGGTVRVSGHTGDSVRVTLDGAGAAWPAALAASLADPARAWRCAAPDGEPVAASRGLQSHLTALLAHDSGLALMMVPDAVTSGPAALVLHLVPAV